MDEFAIHQVMNEVWAVVGEANRYFAAQAPWVLRKTDPARMETVLYVTVELLRQCAIMAQPAVPRAANKLLDLLAIAPDARDFAHLGPAHRMVPGTVLPAPEVIFPALCRAGGGGEAGLMLIDTHCHLDFPDFAPELDQVVARARTAGVERMVTISTHVAKIEQYEALSARFPSVWHTVGTHPHHAAKEPDTPVARLVELSRHPRCVAIGEAGLDYHYDFSPRDVQRQVFLTHIAAARETGLPLVIHAREADDDMISILREEQAKGVFGAILHCFSSGPALAEAGVALGLYVSFSGILTFKRSEELRAIAATVPRDRLLVETDAPYLAPDKWRGKRNEPAYVARTCAVLAEVHGVNADEMAAITGANARRVFAKMDA